MATVKIQLISSRGNIIESKELREDDILACVIYGMLDKKLATQEKKIKRLCSKKTLTSKK